LLHLIRSRLQLLRTCSSPLHLSRPLKLAFSSGFYFRRQFLPSVLSVPANCLLKEVLEARFYLFELQMNLMSLVCFRCSCSVHMCSFILQLHTFRGCSNRLMCFLAVKICFYFHAKSFLLQKRHLD